MRAIDKGLAPNTYREHGDARHDLANVIGYYCSYCEMNVTNMIEVEHIHPVNRGGQPLNWSNFLLACRYCNGVKSDRNTSRNGYLWPDQDNTDLTFEYAETYVVRPITTNTIALIRTYAQNTIDLMGLDRSPHTANQPTPADTRWRSRAEVWDIAKSSYLDWTQAPIIQQARSIARNSISSGHYSIWQEVFKNEPLVLKEIDTLYTTKGLFKQYTPAGIRVIRPNGNI